jgi:hypothetical protein
LKWAPEIRSADVEKRTNAQFAVETALSMIDDFDSFMDSTARRTDVTTSLKPHYASITGRSSP